MPRVIHYAAHPGHSTSRVNKAMLSQAMTVSGITTLDLYDEYPRYNVDIETEQQRLLDHDVILLQFPMFWYSCPALVKEWLDLSWEHGFAYGHNGDKLAGKRLMLAITTGAPQDAYRPQGFQHHEIRQFLLPFEQTAHLCQMRFVTPYVLHGALHADPTLHAQGFARLLEALRDDRLDLDRAQELSILTHDTLPIVEV